MQTSMLSTLHRLFMETYNRRKSLGPYTVQHLIPMVETRVAMKYTGQHYADLVGLIQAFKDADTRQCGTLVSAPFRTHIF